MFHKLLTERNEFKNILLENTLCGPRGRIVGENNVHFLYNSDIANPSSKNLPAHCRLGRKVCEVCFLVMLFVT